MKLLALLLLSALGSFGFVAACGRVDDVAMSRMPVAETETWGDDVVARATPRRKTLTTHEMTVFVERYQ
jgi:hypothetical protein